MRHTLISAVLLVAACVGPPNDPSDASPSSASPSQSVSSNERRPPRELVYIADGELGADRVLSIAMPEGRIVQDIPMPGFVGDGSGAPTAHITSESAFFARTIIEDDLRTFRTFVERIELRTGEHRTVDAGTVRFTGILAIGDHEAGEVTEAERQEALRRYAQQVARSYGRIAAAPDGSRVLLTRPQAGEDSTTRVDTFDGHSLAPLGTTMWREDAPDAFFAIDAERILAVTYIYGDVSSAHEMWTLLDAELRPLATKTFASPAGTIHCSPDVRLLRDGRTWAATCGHAQMRFLQLLDRDRLTDRGTVELGGGQPNPWNVLSWEVTADGSILILTSRPSLIRVDPVGLRVVSHQLVTIGSTPSPKSDRIQQGIRPPARFSPDHRRVYVLYLGADLGGSWRAPISMVDVASGKVMATALEGPGVSAIELSSDGTRLYAIREGKLVTLDAGDLSVLATTDALVTPPGAVLSVVPRD